MKNIIIKIKKKTVNHFKFVFCKKNNKLIKNSKTHF